MALYSRALSLSLSLLRTEALTRVKAQKMLFWRSLYSGTVVVVRVMGVLCDVEQGRLHAADRGR